MSARAVPATVELVFVELPANGERSARRLVENALGALGLSSWVVEEVLPDPDQGDRFGVEVSAPPNTPPDAGWDVAHALADRLGGHAEAVLRTALDEREAMAELGQLLAPRAMGEVFRAVPEGWHLRDIGAAPLPPGSMGAGVRIGHPDTGATPHPELGQGRIRVDLGKNFLEAGPPIDPLDELGQPGHGTATASLMISPAEAQLPGFRPVLGLAPDAEVVPIRVTNTVVILTWQSRLARAIEHAVASGCRVISMSLGGLGGSRLRRALRAARRSGAILVAAAGNYVQFVVWPAAYPEVIGVAATGPGRAPWWGSSKGPAVDITAPGAEIDVARWDDDLGEKRPTVGPGDGTSFATALVASAAALWLSRHRDEIERRYQPVEVHDAFRTVLRRTATRLDTAPFPPSWFGAGMLDCAALLQCPLPDRSELDRTLLLDREAPAARVGLEPMLQSLGLASQLSEAARAAPTTEAVPAPPIAAEARRRVAAFLGRLTSAAEGQAAATEAVGAGATGEGLPAALAVELVQQVILDPGYRASILAALAPGADAGSLPPAPARASQRLRAFLGGPAPEVEQEDLAPPSAPPPVTPMPAGGQAPAAPSTAEQALHLRLNVELEISVGVIRTEYLTDRSGE